MTSLVYFGSVPSSGQIVSSDVSARGLNLVREQPHKLHFVGWRDFTHPSYEMYLSTLPAALKAARENTVVTVKDRKFFYNYPGRTPPPYMKNPVIVWSYGERKPTEFFDTMKDKFNAMETVANGKPALRATLSRAQTADLISSTSPLQTIEANNTTMNIASFKVYLRLHALAHSLLRMHQYALTPSASTSVQTEVSKLVRFSELDMTRDEVAVDLPS